MGKIWLKNVHLFIDIREFVSLGRTLVTKHAGSSFKLVLQTYDITQ